MARFDKGARLLKPGEFSAVLDRGARLPGRLFDAIFVQPGSADRPRLGLALAKRNIALATRRNRLKRLVRESFRQHVTALPAVDIVVTGRRAVAAIADGAVRDELALLWGRIAARCPAS